MILKLKIVKIFFYFNINLEISLDKIINYFYLKIMKKYF